MTDTRATALASFAADVDNLRTFLYGEASHASRRSTGPINPREYGVVIERIGRMAQGSAKQAQIARDMLSKINLYGDRGQLCATVFRSVFETMRAGDFLDVIGATGPEASRRSAHMQPWTLTDKIIARAWCNVLTAGFTASVPGHGWALTDLAAEHGILLPRIPDTQHGVY